MKRVRARRARSPAPARRGRNPLEAVSAICEVLPASVPAVHGSHADFCVRGRVYAYFLDDHHGDGIVSVCCRSELGEHVDRVYREPERFYLPAYIGARGWFGLRLDRGRVDWQEVAALVERSWRLAAPKTLVKARLASQQQPPLT